MEKIEVIKNALRFIRDKVAMCLFYVFRIIPINQKKLVITNYYGKGFGDNGKYIALELLKGQDHYDIVWLAKHEVEAQFPEGIRIVPYRSIRAIFEQSTAKVWIDNSRKSYYIRKRKGQYYIQTWHGGIALKKIEMDVESKLDRTYVRNLKNDSKIANLFISNSDFCTKLYRSAFHYGGEILECGSPRCDILLNKDRKVIHKVKEYFNINFDENILIYAPTFRNDTGTNVYDIDFENLIRVVKDKFGGKWKVLVRLHPNVSEKDNFMEYNSLVINATHYNDMYELLLASDILITDYSSTMFEFSFARKPVFLYATDIDDYIKDRNFYFDINSLPYPLAESNEQLFDLIERFNSHIYSKELDSFLSKLEIKEKGNASYQVVEKIKQVIS